jgi:general secretion pathway protein I
MRSAPLPQRRLVRGFTLIEVLAALVIVALGMLAAIEAVNQSTRNGTYLREKTLAHWIGMNIVTERRLDGAPPEVGDSSGEVEFAGQRWRWDMRVTQTQVQSLRRMNVTVRRADARDEKSSLATVSGFYGTAIGAAGGSNLSWVGQGAPGTGGGGTDGEVDGQPDNGDKGGGTDNNPALPGSDNAPPAPPPSTDE